MKHLAAGLAALIACAADPLAAFDAPPGWPEAHYRFENNAPTAAGFELGRALFYDPVLSADGSIACASCHQQSAAFAHARHRVSHGIGDQLGTRNAPALFNLAWQPDFMWDGAVTHLELQPLAPLANPVEMGATLPQALAKLRAHPEYPRRFEQAFGSPGIDSQRLLRALAQFMGSMVSADSAYDRAQHGGAPLSPEADHGLALFRRHCAACHAEPLFTDFSYRNNGLDAAPRDAGRAAISGDARDRGRFRVPSLRNVALTAPYMHDGRFDTLSEVLDHYAGGVQPSPTLDARLAAPRDLSAADRHALLAFLDALTDERFVRDARFAESPTPAAVSVPRGWPERLGELLEGLLTSRAQAHDRAAQPVVPAAPRGSAPARFALAAPPVEIVGVRDARGLRVWVDDFLSNAPRDGLSLSLLQETRLVRATAEGPGVYRFEIDAPGGEAAALVVRGPALDLRVEFELPAAAGRREP